MYQFQKFPATVSCKMFFEKKNCMRKEKKTRRYPQTSSKLQFLYRWGQNEGKRKGEDSFAPPIEYRAERFELPTQTSFFQVYLATRIHNIAQLGSGGTTFKLRIHSQKLGSSKNKKLLFSLIRSSGVNDRSCGNLASCNEHNTAYFKRPLIVCYLSHANSLYSHKLTNDLESEAHHQICFLVLV